MCNPGLVQSPWGNPGCETRLHTSPFLLPSPEAECATAPSTPDVQTPRGPQAKRPAATPGLLAARPLPGALACTSMLPLGPGHAASPLPGALSLQPPGPVSTRALTGLIWDQIGRDVPKAAGAKRRRWPCPAGGQGGLGWWPGLSGRGERAGGSGRSGAVYAAAWRLRPAGLGEGHGSKETPGPACPAGLSG